MSSKSKKNKQKQKQKPQQAKASTAVEQGPSDLQFMSSMLGRLCLLGALGLACYLAITSLMQGSVAGCGEGGGCHEVLASKWAYAIGLPVSLFGALSYVVLLVCDLRGRWPLMHALVRWTIIGAALWFVILQVAVVKQFCPWCCITHTLAILGSLLLWPRGKSAKRPSSPWLAPAMGAAGVLGLILTQSLGPERPTTAGGELAEGTGSKVEAPTPEEGPRTVSLHSGKFTIDVDEYPTIGNARTATHVAVGLFDFTCPHCRHLIEILTDVQKQFRNDFAVVQLPGHYSSKGEAIQKKMLAIWREDRETYNSLAEMLHAGGIQATEAGVNVAIEGMLDPATHQLWMARHADWSTKALAQSQEIRTANKVITKSGRFPQLIIGDYVEAGSKPNAGYYYQLLNEKLGLKRTAIPQLAWATSAKDLGSVIAGSTQQFEITLRNPGQYPANIQRIKTEAGMRLSGEAPKVIAPGAEVKVPFTASVPPRAGLVKGVVTVLSDAEPANLEATVTATITQPYTIDFGTPPSAPGAPATNKVTANNTLDLGIFDAKAGPLEGKVTIRFDDPVKLGVPKSNNSKEFVPTLKETEPGKVFELSIKANPSVARKGLHQGSISLPLTPIDATVPWPSQLRIPVRCRVGTAPIPSARMKVPGTSKPKTPSATPPVPIPIK